MKLTKLGHSCVRLEKAGRTIVIDPGAFSDPAHALAGADAVLVTHEHADHLDPDALRKAMSENPELHLWAPAPVAGTLADLGERVHTAEPNSQFTVGGFDVRTCGGQHAVIHLLLPVVTNVGYLIDDAVYHPGDSFTIPTGRVEALLVPIHAPWSKLNEVVDFVIAVRAPLAFPIHDGMLNEIGLGMVESHIARLSAPFGTTYRHLDVGESVELD